MTFENSNKEKSIFKDQKLSLTSAPEATTQKYSILLKKRFFRTTFYRTTQDDCFCPDLNKTDISAYFLALLNDSREQGKHFCNYQGILKINNIWWFSKGYNNEVGNLNLRSLFSKSRHFTSAVLLSELKNNKFL